VRGLFGLCTSGWRDRDRGDEEGEDAEGGCDAGFRISLQGVNSLRGIELLLHGQGSRVRPQSLEDMLIILAGNVEELVPGGLRDCYDQPTFRRPGQ